MDLRYKTYLDTDNYLVSECLTIRHQLDLNIDSSIFQQLRLHERLDGSFFYNHISEKHINTLSKEEDDALNPMYWLVSQVQYYYSDHKYIKEFDFTAVY